MFFLKTKLFLAPLELSGEGTYAITDVKEIEVTKDFLGQDDKTKKCQDKVSLEDCITRQYLDKLMKVCKCVPYGLRNFTMKVQAFVN